ncbi:Uma2 family endonuclease [Streptomyces sp. NPDC001678]|uniref:Uma2 family endonuclease n=1 Tax=Streptomyces sp. NPDC001678 TaxID=3364599 RepID=UPI003678DD70
MTTTEMRKFEEFDASFPEHNAEMIDGQVCINTVVTSGHGQAVLAIAAQLVDEWCVMTKVDTVYEGWRGTTLLRPDLSVAAPAHHGADLPRFPAEEIILVTEVTSRSTFENDTRRKVAKYAQAGIPYYLVVDPIKGRCLLHSLPEDGRYRSKVESKFGDPVSVGAPLDTDIDTSALYTY